MGDCDSSLVRPDRRAKMTRHGEDGGARHRRRPNGRAYWPPFFEKKLATLLPPE